MAYDDIIVGAGLTGLATALGLPGGRRILVLSEERPGTVRYYDQQSNVPCAVRAPGGLGNYWHGVIPFDAMAKFAGTSAGAFESLLARFYPQLDASKRSNSPWLFVPRSPIRPMQWWAPLAKERNGRLNISTGTALDFTAGPEKVVLRATTGTIEATRLWICAGALDTPALLARSLHVNFGFRGTADDHAIIYLGRLDSRDHGTLPPVEVERVRSGYWFKARPESTADRLVTAKPAHFSYRQLDHGIEQRAAFGLPVGGAIGKITRAGSLGLLAEAAFNKMGLFAASPVQSVYAQVRIAEAHDLDLESGRLRTKLETIRRQLSTAREEINIANLERSRRPELFIRGIHLHNTLDVKLLAAAGINTDQAAVRIQDASAIESIGGEHHSFHMMAAAFSAAGRA